MNLKNKKIFVTGAEGFIGSHLVEELAEKNYEIKALYQYNSQNNTGNLEFLPEDIKNKIDIIGGDIRDPFLIRKVIEGSDVVFHLASLIAIPYSYIAPLSYIKTNTEGTLNVMQACLDFNIKKIIHTSTSETYGTAIYSPIDEKHPLQAQSPYSASKIGADKIVESYHKSFNLPVSTIRPFNCFGPRQSARAVIPTIIMQALTNNIIKLGSLEPVRDFTFVKDTVSAFINIAESDNSIGQVINIGTGKGINIGDLSKKICELMNKNLPIKSEDNRIRPQNSEVLKLICNNEKAKKLLNWEPKYSLKEGLNQTIEFIKKNIEIFKIKEYNI